MEKKLPKNVRQIGNVSDNPKIYVEDYVDTFLIQLNEKAKEQAIGAFFVGEIHRKDDGDYIFVNGAIQMHTLEMRGNEVVVDDKTWRKGCEESKEFFEGKTILGWCLLAPDIQLKLNNNLIKVHEKIFMKKSRLFMMKNSTEKEETFFVYKYNDLMKVSGHYIYYEKNPMMQEYMISKRKQNCVTPSEPCEDRVTKDFRSAVRQKEMKKASKSKGRFVHVASLFLVLAVVVIGVTAFNRYEEMQSVETSENDEVDVVVEEIIEQEDEVESTDSEESEGSEGLPDLIGADEIEENSDVIGENEEDAVQTEVIEAIAEEGNESVLGQGDEAQMSNYKTYTVQEGDTLAKISEKHYGTIKRVEDICEINGLDDSDYIYIGQQLRMP